MTEHAEAFTPAIEGIRKLSSEAVGQAKQAVGFLTAQANEPEVTPDGLTDVARMLSEAEWRARLMASGLDEARRRVRQQAQRLADNGEEGAHEAVRAIREGAGSHS